MVAALLALGALGCKGGGGDTDTGAPPHDEPCDERAWYVDDDGDGFGADEVLACDQPSGTVEDEGDCDDDDERVHPDATEICNGLDDDCDGLEDEGVTELLYADDDGDGHGGPLTVEACAGASGTANSSTDCDDTDAAVHPDAEEICDGIDNDCDGEEDEDVDGTWYADADNDGYGDPDVAVDDCDEPTGYVDNADDCDDDDGTSFPGAPADYCDGADNDCDGTVDEDVKDGWILVSVDNGAGVVVEIDPATAAVSTLSTLSDTTDGSLNSMDVRDADGFAIVHGNDNTLHELDACTGNIRFIGDTGVGDMGGISFTETGALYGNDHGNDQLVAIDVATGVGTPIGPLGFDPTASGLAYDCSTDTLYGADSGGQQIYQLDRSTGAAHSFVSVSVPFNGVGLEFDHTDGTLLASTGNSNALYRIDPATGSSTYIGELDTDNANDLAFHPPCK